MYASFLLGEGGECHTEGGKSHTCNVDTVTFVLLAIAEKDNSLNGSSVFFSTSNKK